MRQEQPGRRKPLEAKIAKSRMIIRTAPWCPVILALRLLDRQIVDGSKPQAHQPVLIELPILISIRAKPIPGVIVPFIGKAHGDTVSLERPRLFERAERTQRIRIHLVRQVANDNGTPLPTSTR